MVINVAPQAIICGHENPAFFPRFALKAAKPSDSRPLSRGSKSPLLNLYLYLHPLFPPASIS